MWMDIFGCLRVNCLKNLRRNAELNLRDYASNELYFRVNGRIQVCQRKPNGLCMNVHIIVRTALFVSKVWILVNKIKDKG